MSKTVDDFFAKLGACSEAAEWAKSAKSLREAWETCQRPDWILWALERIDFRDDRKFRLYACACARGTPLADGRTLWELLADKRSRTAVEVAERYAEGNATEIERNAAWSAAWNAAGNAAWNADKAAAKAAAYAAAYAAGNAFYAYASAADAAVAYAAGNADARKTVREWQANILRQWISWNEVEAAIDAWKAKA
jgi:hypothetical protein